MPGICDPRNQRDLGATLGSGSDLSNDIFGWVNRSSKNLLGDLFSVNRDLTRELEGNAHPVTLDRSDPDDPDWGRGISDDYFFAFASGDDQHDARTSCP